MSPRSEFSGHHLKIVSDYANANPGDHVYLFSDKKIVYGGQLNESTNGSVAYVNGTVSPLSNPETDTYVPERQRGDANDDGVWTVDTQNGATDKCVPYFFTFEDRNGLQGSTINTPQLYNPLERNFSFALPSNATEDKGFCPITPGENRKLLSLLSDAGSQTTLGNQTKSLPKSHPLDFEFLKQPHNARYESEVEAFFLRNPDAIPELGNHTEYALARQIPLSARRPGGPDEIDICAYTEDSYYPSIAYELKRDSAKKKDARQINKYVAYSDSLREYSTPEFVVCASHYTSKFCKTISNKSLEHLTMRTYDEQDTVIQDFCLKESASP